MQTERQKGAGGRKKGRQIKRNKGETKGERISEEKEQVRERELTGVKVMIGSIKGREST